MIDSWIKILGGENRENNLVEYDSLIWSLVIIIQMKHILCQGIDIGFKISIEVLEEEKYKWVWMKTQEDLSGGGITYMETRKTMNYTILKIM